MRAVAYVRVSNASQVDGHSLTAQARLFRELCKNRGWEPVGVYREEGRSAHVDSIKKRPVFRQLMDDVHHKRFDVVVVHTLDRWSRNLRVGLEAIAILARHEVGLVSITENLDWSTPAGRLTANMLGGMAQFYSESLGTHVKKGLDQRAYEGKHTGGLPFSYASCWDEQDGSRRRVCDPEHSGGVHVVPEEAEAVKGMFRRYASGTTTLAELAIRLNREGFRTRNTKRLPGPDGELVSGPRLFTTASVRGILHNPFYVGLVRHRNEVKPGAHEPLVSKEVFEHVQAMMKRRSGRSRTYTPHPERHYLLKGLVRCVHCGMPMWAQTYKNGRRYYREHRESRSIARCPAAGGFISCDVADEQVGEFIRSIRLPDDWLDRALERVKLKDRVKHVQEERKRLGERLRRMAKAFVDGLFDDGEYRRQKEQIEFELASLVVPEADITEEAGKLLVELPRLWAGATPEERRRLLLTVLDAVYVDTQGEKRVVEVRPKAAFRAVWSEPWKVGPNTNEAQVRRATINGVEIRQSIVVGKQEHARGGFLATSRFSI